MITCAAQNPAGKQMRRNYIHRAWAVMLCCVLVLGLLPYPRAHAEIIDGTSAFKIAGMGSDGLTVIEGGSGAAATVSPVMSVLGGLLLVQAGIEFYSGELGVGEDIFVGSEYYQAGAKFAAWVETAAGTVMDWMDATAASIEAAGGFTAGQSIEVPAEVAEAARQWAAQQYTIDNPVTVTDSGIVNASGDMILFFEISGYTGVEKSHGALAGVLSDIATWGTPLAFGTIIKASGDRYYKFAMRDDDYNSASWQYASAVDGDWKDQNGFYVQGWSVYTRVPYGFVVNYNGYLAFGAVGPSLSAPNSIWVTSVTSYAVDALTIDNTVTATDAVSTAITDDVAITVPSDVPMTQVGDLIIPAVSTLTQADVLTGADNPAEPTAEPTTAPATGETVGDIALDDVAEIQPSLSAVILSKFPFCIPWDFVQAVKLLAAPAQAPVIEADPLGDLAPLFGGRSAGDTTIRLDMSDYEFLGGFCRWITTLMFCAALIGATKRLIWT